MMIAIRSAFLSVLAVSIAPGTPAVTGLLVAPVSTQGPLPTDPILEAVVTDGPTIRGRLATIEPDGGIVLVAPGGERRTLSPGDWIKLAREAVEPATSAVGSGLLVFPDGDQLVATVERADDRAVIARSSAVNRENSIEVPLEALLGIAFGGGAGRASPGDVVAFLRRAPRTADLLLFGNGDRLAGAFRSASQGEVTMRFDDREQRIDRSSVSAVGLDPALSRYPEPDGLSYDLVLTDGSRLRLTDPRLRDGRLAGSTRFGVEVEVDQMMLLDLYVVGGAARYLSDLEPAGEVSVPYIGPVRPVRRDASVLDRPLIVGGRRYARGLGTQSRSLLAYRLDPEDRHLQGLVALDDAAGPLGNLVFRVLVDSEERFASPPLAVGDPPMSLDVDVSGGSVLILATEYGRGGGVRDYADWLELRLTP